MLPTTPDTPRARFLLLVVFILFVALFSVLICALGAAIEASGECEAHTIADRTHALDALLLSMAPPTAAAARRKDSHPE